MSVDDFRHGLNRRRGIRSAGDIPKAVYENIPVMMDARTGHDVCHFSEILEPGLLFK